MAGMLVVFFLIFYIGVESSYVEEGLLYTKLLDGYKKSIRPAINNKPLQIQFQIKLQEIRSYKLKDQILVLSAFTMMSWRDVRLQWNITDYNGIERMNFDSDEIWTPDIVLYNTAYGDRESYTDTYPAKAIVMNDGKVIWNMPVIWYASCQSDITWFPIDLQSCDLDFGSWSYSRSQIEIISWKNNYTTSKPFTVPNGEWKIKKANTSYSDESFSCCPERFSIMRFSLTFIHLSKFYFIYIIIPLIALCFLFLLVFYIPRSSGERLGFGVTILLSITVYLLVISDKLPEKSDVDPMLGIIFTIEFFVLCFGLAVAACSVAVNERHKNKPPLLLMKLAGITDVICRRVNNSEKFLETIENERPVKMERIENRHQAESDESMNCLKPQNSPKPDFYEDWTKISDWIDKAGFFTVLILIILLPVIVVLSLDTGGRK